MQRRGATAAWSAFMQARESSHSMWQCATTVQPTQALLKGPAYSQPAFTEPDLAVNPAPSQKVLSIVDSIESLTMKEVVWLNKELKDRLGITDADLGIGMPMVAAAAPAAAQPATPPEEEVEEKKNFTVVVEGYDAAAKIKIIKELRAVLPELGLKEAKALVDKLPATIKEDIPKEIAEEIEKKLAAAGAQVVLK